MNRVKVFDQRSGTDPAELDSALAALQSSLEDNVEKTFAVTDTKSDHMENSAFLLASMQEGARALLLQSDNNTIGNYDNVLLSDSAASLTLEDMTGPHRLVLEMLHSETDSLVAGFADRRTAADASAQEALTTVRNTLDRVQDNFNKRIGELQLSLHATFTNDGEEEDDDISDDRLRELDKLGHLVSGSAEEYITQRNKEVQLYDTARARIEELGATETALCNETAREREIKEVDAYTRRVARILANIDLDSTKSTASLMHNTYKRLRLHGAP